MNGVIVPDVLSSLEPIGVSKARNPPCFCGHIFMPSRSSSNCIAQWCDSTKRRDSTKKARLDKKGATQEKI